MTTPKKKHLIELMIEAGVKWPESAEYAAQDKVDNNVYFFDSKPAVQPGGGRFLARGGAIGKHYLLPSLCLNWHQTLVTREQYEQALANATITVEDNHCNSMLDQIPIGTIEQLANEYYAKTAEAECLQYEADEARKLANEALITLQKAGELIGLVISVDTLQKCTKQHQQPVITDWRDLRVGDVIKCMAYGDERDNANTWPGGWARSIVDTIHIVGNIDPDTGKISLQDTQDSGYAFRFIYRP